MSELRVYMWIDAPISADEAAALLDETRKGAIVSAVAAAGTMSKMPHEMVNLEFIDDHYLGDFEANATVLPLLRAGLAQQVEARGIAAADERGMVEAVLQAEFSEAAARVGIDPALIVASVIGYGEREESIAEANEALYG